MDVGSRAPKVGALGESNRDLFKVRDDFIQKTGTTESTRTTCHALYIVNGTTYPALYIVNGTTCPAL